jgi:hypothetical protein
MSNDLPDLGGRYDPALVELVRLVVMSSFDDLWSERDMGAARQALHQRYGRVPDLAAVAERFGTEAVKAIAREWVAERVAFLREAMERMGTDSPCHLCARPRRDEDPHYEFGLARNVQTKTHWGGALGALALNVVTLPLGVAVAGRPGSTTTANIARCRLVLCQACALERRGFFGGIRPSQTDCERHPSWGRLQAEGFTRFLDKEALAQFR